MQGPCTQTTGQKEACIELLVCTVFLLSEPLDGSSWNPISTNRTEAFPIQSESQSSISISIITGQSRQPHSDQFNFEDLKSSFAWGWTIQGSRVGVCVCVNQLPSGSERALAFSTKDWWLCFPSWSWNTENEAQSTAEQSCPAGRGLAPRPPHSHAVS